MATIKEDLEAIEHAVDELLEDVPDNVELSDEDAKDIIDTEQRIAEKISNLLAAHGVEIGDERMD